MKLIALSSLVASVLAASHDVQLPLLAQLGIAAPFAFALFWAYRQSVARGDRLEAIVTSSLAATGEYAAALRESTKANHDSAEAIREMVRVLDRRGGGDG